MAIEAIKTELLDPDKPIARFDEFRAQLNELRQWNESQVFDYRDPKGNKEARSHIYKLRQSRAAVEKARQDEKRVALEYGRRVDSEAKEIMGELEDMIETHAAPIREIEEAEKQRVQAHKDKIDWMRKAPSGISAAGLSAADIRQTIAQIEKTDPGQFEEFAQDASVARDNALAELGRVLERAVQAEAEHAELERMRAEKEAREKAEAEEKAKREAEERERREAEAARERELAEARRQAEEAKKALEEERWRAAQAAREAQEKREAEERARREAAEREAREKAEAEERARAAEEKRRADEALRSKVHNAIATDLYKNGPGLLREGAMELADRLMDGKVPYCKVEF